jgi:hypothetical protein
MLFAVEHEQVPRRIHSNALGIDDLRSPDLRPGTYRLVLEGVLQEASMSGVGDHEQGLAAAGNSLGAENAQPCHIDIDRSDVSEFYDIGTERRDGQQQGRYHHQ